MPPPPVSVGVLNETATVPVPPLVITAVTSSRDSALLLIASTMAAAVGPALMGVPVPPISKLMVRPPLTLVTLALVLLGRVITKLMESPVIPGIFDSIWIVVTLGGAEASKTVSVPDEYVTPAG